jgi:hypothetical protein
MHGPTPIFWANLTPFSPKDPKTISTTRAQIYSALAFAERRLAAEAAA